MSLTANTVPVEVPLVRDGKMDPIASRERNILINECRPESPAMLGEGFDMFNDRAPRHSSNNPVTEVFTFVCSRLFPSHSPLPCPRHSDA